MAEATWKKGYLQGSFRGVEFFISGSQSRGGRRIATHQFPGVDDIYHEDLGRGIRSYTFSAYIIGDNYFQHRENLIAALETKGVGRLVHPYRGVFEVVCKNFTESETTKEGRVARFDLQFEEQRVNKLTTVVKNTPSEVREKKYSLIDKINNSFANAYSIATTGRALTDPGQPNGVLVSPVSVAAVQDIIKQIDHTLTVVESAKKTVSAFSEFQRELENVRGRTIQLALNGQDLAASLQEIIDFGTDPLGSVAQATTGNSLAQLLEMVEIAKDTSTPTTGTPPDLYDDPNYPAKKVQALSQELAIGSAVGLVPVTPLKTIQDAENLRTELFSLLNTLSEKADTDDLLFESIRDAKAAVEQDLDRRILDLANLVVFQVPETNPSLKITNEIYGDLEKEQDFIDRNEIGHPGFVKGNTDLEVEIDAG